MIRVTITEVYDLNEDDWKGIVVGPNSIYGNGPEPDRTIEVTVVEEDA